ncbi:MAG: hypothetical protein KDA85_07870 [Planctomycetaceae bacterium]|nr:hypothetical protein [Planctomycetaceae bacterium]
MNIVSFFPEDECSLTAPRHNAVYRHALFVVVEVSIDIGKSGQLRNPESCH